MLRFDDELTNGIFHVEFCFVPVTGTNRSYNSGVFIRNSVDGTIWHQAQLTMKGGYWFGNSPTKGVVGRFGTTPTELRMRPAGEWNTIEVTARGKKLSVWLNGAVTCVWDQCEVPSGYIALEAEGYRILFRNLKYKNLASAPASPATYLQEISNMLAQQWPSNRTVTIVCHGHSVPAGYFKTPVVDTFNAYPHLLHEALKARFAYAVLNVTVTAIGGENSESGARRFEHDVLALHPDVVTIDYGLNDRAIGLKRAETAWRSMITQALQQHIKVILLTPTPDLKANLNDPADPLNQQARQIRQLANEYGVALADSLARFKEYAASGGQVQELMAQTNHPNRKGHDLVLAELLRWFP